MTKLSSNISYNRIKDYLFWILIFTGLIIRLLSFRYNGIFDMAVYHEWGINTLNKGLAFGYQGTYFPFQYQVFEFASWLSEILNIKYFITFKAVNLLFDTGNLIVLYLILKEFKISKYYLLIYWLHPWFLLMFSQGYCDFHFTFFILCSLYFTIKATSRNYLISGLFLGLAFHMKPQVQVIVLAFFIYAAYLYIKTRDIKIFHIFIFPAIIFINYSVYFFILRGNPFVVLRDFVDLPDSMPLTANFLNIWFPLAYYLKNPSEPIYSVYDDIVFNNVSIRSIALMVLLVLIFMYVIKFYKEYHNTEKNYNLYMVACFSTFIFPFIMTSAHENHLFLGTVLFIPYLGRVKNILVRLSYHVVILLQCINLYGYYGYGEDLRFKGINFNYTYETGFLLSLIAFLSFLILVFFLLSNKPHILAQPSQPESLKMKNRS